MEISCQELLEAAQEYQIRNLCFWVCVDLVANAIGRCEFRTFRGNKEIFEKEYWLWNFEPNANQNSTMFLHKLVAKLFEDNEALIIETTNREPGDAIIVADSWTPPLEYPSRQQEYTNVTVGEVTYQKTFYEREIMHLKLNHVNIKPVIDGLYQSYGRLLSAAMRYYEWDHGQHWKVHVSQLASGGDDWEEKFRQRINQQVKPFLESNGAVLPEFDGYEYTNMGKNGGSSSSRDVKDLIEDVFDFTARGFLLPVVLVNGKVEATEDATRRLLTNCVDPICDQIQEEATKKRYGYEAWRRGDFLRVDSSAIQHFDIFANAPNVEKLVGSGAFTINDVMRAANQPKIDEPWADQHFLTKNISTLQDGTQALDDQKGGNP